MRNLELCLICFVNIVRPRPGSISQRILFNPKTSLPCREGHKSPAIVPFLSTKGTRACAFINCISVDRVICGCIDQSRLICVLILCIKTDHSFINEVCPFFPDKSSPFAVLSFYLSGDCFKGSLPLIRNAEHRRFRIGQIISIKEITGS